MYLDLPVQDPASGLQLVCDVLWDDQPHRSDDVAVSVLRSHLLPAFVEDPNLVPAKVWHYKHMQLPLTHA
jgi:hypothetical protein